MEKASSGLVRALQLNAISMLSIVVGMAIFGMYWQEVVNIPSYDGRTYIQLARAFDGLDFGEAAVLTKDSFKSTHTKLFGFLSSPILNEVGYTEENIASVFAFFLILNGLANCLLQ